MHQINIMNKNFTFNNHLETPDGIGWGWLPRENFRRTSLYTLGQNQVYSRIIDRTNFLKEYEVVTPGYFFFALLAFALDENYAKCVSIVPRNGWLLMQATGDTRKWATPQPAMDKLHEILDAIEQEYTKSSAEFIIAHFGIAMSRVGMEIEKVTAKKGRRYDIPSKRRFNDRKLNISNFYGIIGNDIALSVIYTGVHYEADVIDLRYDDGHNPVLVIFGSSAQDIIEELKAHQEEVCLRF